MAGDVNPVPSGELCPDGTPKLVWNYPYFGGIPSNATKADCGGAECYVFPQSACLEALEVPEQLHSRKVPGTINPPDPPLLLPPEVPKEPTAPVTQKPTSPSGESAVPIPAPDQDCEPGDGWDFEKAGSALPTHAELDNWKGKGLPFEGIENVDLHLIAAPVYGNAVPIDRIRPPGWMPNIKPTIGGDYWIYSQDINYHGDFWLSSLYRRYSWGQQPGAGWDEADTGILISPECILRARYLSFRMSGGRSQSQRIEVQVAKGNPRDYFGIRFPESFGSGSYHFGHGTQFPSYPPRPQQFSPADGAWVALRTVTSEDLTEGEWMQVYVFDLAPFNGAFVRIRVVDDRRGECAHYEAGICKRYYQEHINADDFRFADSPPEGVEWMTFDEGQCGGVEGTGDGCSPIGRVPSEPPLWGITDAHAHPMANLAFGGHVIWGDVSDKLEDVYDCSHALPAIPGPGGRAAIAEAAVTSKCYIAGDVAVIVTGTGLAACTVLTVVPVFGVAAAMLCKAAMTLAGAILFTHPIIEGLTLHGAQRFANGAVKIGGILLDSWIGYLKLIGQLVDDPQEFSLGLLPETDPWSNVEPEVAWYPADEKWHSFTGLGKTHNHYQADMIRRAFDGGMRLAVWDVVNSRALAFVADGNPYASDWQALKDQTDGAKRIVGTTLSNIAKIAYSPQEAEQIIRSGKLAVILGSEVDELGRMRPDGLAWPRSPHTPGDSMQKQIDDLFELGIRKVTPVHAVNNPIGGPAIFTDKYVANDHFVNATPLDGTPSSFDQPKVRFILDRSVAGILMKVILGEFSIIEKIGGDGKTPWNPEGWFEIDGPPPPGDGFIDDYLQVTYRISQDAQKLQDDNGKWLPPKDVLGKRVLIPQALNDLSSFIRPKGRCDIHHTVLPDHADSFGPVVDEQFIAVAGHRNRLGIFRNGGEDGEAFLRALMKKGMMLDVDHLSQKMRVAVYTLAASYAREAGWPALPHCTQGKPCGDYPVMGVHSTVRELEKEGSARPHLINAFGSNDESTRTPREISHVAANGGTIGLFPRSTTIPPNTFQTYCNRDTDCTSWDGSLATSCDHHQCTKELPAQPAPDFALVKRDFLLPPEIKNHCDGSTETFAIKYLWLMRQMKGRGLTFTSDINGIITPPYPRFGQSIPGSLACGAGARATTLRAKPEVWQFLMSEWQKIEHNGIWYEDYAANSPAVSHLADHWPDPDLPAPKKRWKEVIARHAGSIREDRPPQFQTFSDGAPILDRVYYNDYGPDIANFDWQDQDGNRPGAQLFPMKRWRKQYDGWDYNLDGFQHIGLLPDLVQDMRNVGVQWEQMGPLFHGARDYIATWRRSIRIGSDHP